VYELSGDGVAVSIPQRRYQLIAEILAAAVDADPARADQAATRLAQDRGHAVGGSLAAAHAGHADPMTALAELGFEPHPAENRIVLRNCPFHALAAQHTALICGLNLAFVDGVLDGLRAGDRQAVLAPHPGRCCVEVIPRPS
jgi:predicted ArsR family transcriptional regulator